jgi:anthranilate synthase component 2
MNILIVDNYDSFTFNLYHYFLDTGAKVVVHRNDAVPQSALNDASHIVLSPGPGLPEQAGCMMDVILRYKGQKPLLGVCLGMQAIALAYGGELYNLKNVMHGRSVSIRQASGNRFFKGLPSHFEVGLYHSWAVQHAPLPEELRPTAFSEQEVLMGLEDQTLPVSGVQFHPESVMTPLGKQMLNNWAFQKI